MRELIILLIFVSRTGISFSQSVFDIQYRLPDAAHTLCSGFMYKNDDSTGFVRLWWMDRKLRKKINGDFDFAKGLQRELVYPFTNDTFLFCRAELVNAPAGTDENTVDQITIWFKKNKKSGGKYFPCTGEIPFEYPAGIPAAYLRPADFTVLPPSKNKSGNPIVKGYPSGVISFSSKAPATLTRPYLLQFFSGQELLHKRILSIKDIIPERISKPPSIYCITVLDSKDSSIGQTCKKDQRTVADFFKNVSMFLNLPLIPISISGNNFSLETVKDAIKNIKPGGNDIVVFAYSGHGFSYRNDEQHPFPQLALWYGDAESKAELRASTINIEEVYKLIKAKGGRLNIVFSDCCNSYVEMKRYEDTQERGFAYPYTRWTRSTCIKLFAGAKGSYLMAATEKGQMAGSHPAFGGFFTYSLFNTLEQLLINKKIKNPEWKSILLTTGAAAANLSSGYICGDSPCIQHMIYKTDE